MLLPILGLLDKLIGFALIFFCLKIRPASYPVEFGLLTLLPFSEVGGIDLYGREEKIRCLYRKLGPGSQFQRLARGQAVLGRLAFVGKL